MSYIDLTNQYTQKQQYQVKQQNFFISEDGTKYQIDGKHVILEPSERELEVAEIIGQCLGGIVTIIPRVNEPPNIQTPDYMINGEKFDLKQLRGSGKYVIEGNLRKKLKQANNFIIDLTSSKLLLDEACRQVRGVFDSKRFLWIDKIFIIRENQILKIYGRR